MILRDVINTKSSYKNRHSINANDIKEISKYYAIESRIYNSIIDENNEIKKGPLWLMNYLIFDFDFDEEHYTLKENETFESVLNKNINILLSILGTPKYIIKNKNFENEIKNNRLSNYRYNQIINTYFTDYSDSDNIKIKMPKKYGCQVVYELKESIKSQYPEQYRFFNYFRKIINELCCADQNFKNHVFKNFYNNELFDITENKDYNEIDIYEITKNNKAIFNKIKENNYYRNLDDSIKGKNFEFLIDKIHYCEQFKYLNSDNRDPLDIIFENYSNKLTNFYFNLNSYKTDKEKNKNYGFNSTSRNECLFNYFKSIDINSISNEENSYNSLVVNNSYNIFDNCDIKEPIDEYEFENTKESVLFYRQNNLLTERIVSIPDNKFHVFKLNYINRSESNISNFNDFILKDKDKILNLLINTNKYDKCIIKFSNRGKEQLYNCDLYSIKGLQYNLILSNYFIIKGYDTILNNIKNVFNKDFLQIVKEIIDNFEDSSKYGLYDLFTFVKDAIYYTHFKIYYTIKNKRNLINRCNTISTNSRCRINNRFNRLINNINYINLLNINKNNYLLFLMLSKGLIKNCNNLLKSKPISFYQSYFNISNVKATLLSRFIKKLLNNSKFNNYINYNNYFNKNYLLNYFTSEYYFNIINNFIIYKYNLYYYLFFIKDNIYI